MEGQKTTKALTEFNITRCCKAMEKELPEFQNKNEEEIEMLFYLVLCILF